MGDHVAFTVNARKPGRIHLVFTFEDKSMVEVTRRTGITNPEKQSPRTIEVVVMELYLKQIGRYP